MGRGDIEATKNPAKLFLEWSPKRGALEYYDKEKGERVAVKLPFAFMVLEETAKIGGGTKRQGKFEGFWSNAVLQKNIGSGTFTVKSKQGVEAQGLYAELKDKKGFKYVKGLYIAYYDTDKNLAIGHLELSGSSLGAWFDFLDKEHPAIFNGAFTIKGKSAAIAGENGDYYPPVFAYKSDITPESNEAATQLFQTELKPYLTEYFANAANGNGHYAETDDGESPKVRAATADTGSFEDLAPGEPPLYPNGTPDDPDFMPF